MKNILRVYIEEVLKDTIFDVRDVGTYICFFVCDDIDEDEEVISIRYDEFTIDEIKRTIRQKAKAVKYQTFGEEFTEYLIELEALMYPAFRKYKIDSLEL